MVRRGSFGSSVPRRDKATRGAAPAGATPVTVRSRIELVPAFERTIRPRLSRKLGAHALEIERVTIRFTDVNGPRGGVGTDCELKVVLRSAPSVIVSKRAAAPAIAFARAMASAARSLRSRLDRRGGSASRGSRAELRAPDKAVGSLAPPWTSLIGRDVGRSAANLGQALDRPEKRRRDALVDTALPGVSATARKAGGEHSARRNTRRPRSGMTAALEDSRGKPSRKSTRRSSNRAKTSQGKERTAVARTLSPSARAARGRLPKKR
jgi:hypothetical protein